MIHFSARMSRLVLDAAAATADADADADDAVSSGYPRHPTASALGNVFPR